ncbi:hypothetical protein GEV33_006727 [Tenebrio molitor]|uniref:DNA helicase n=1 Tax=Tenebrio molitor TaxID=7067 RepID=A0A8J6HK20_TENMO|nr:hypothetical protein GEV33_006727 [Tenebrio molitor]
MNTEGDAANIYSSPLTCNPKWIEIVQLLLPGQTSSDRHDITARIFKQKIQSLMHYIVQHRVFGDTRCWMYSIEWQKRGLPHAHILIWLVERIRPDQIDDIIYAEIPNPEIDPGLHDGIITNMIHGPCGAINSQSPCMVDGKCSKRYPRNLTAETITGNDGYPMYRRRSPDDNGRTITTEVKGNDFVIDNTWIVPYSPLLSKIFKAHCNVEYCNSVKSIKYICKYVTKGSDMAVFGVQTPDTNDEITHYQVGRYVSYNEAIWRIFSFPIHERHPTVVHLAVHLENGQRVYFNTSNVAQRAETPPATTLTSFFSICQSDPFARTLLYTEFLNSLDLPGLPPHNFQLNIGSVVIMLRNQNQPKLCNGTRLVEKKLMGNVIHATILKVSSKDKESEKMEGWSVPVTPLKIEATFLTVTTPVSTSKPKYSLSSDSEDDPFAARDDSNEYIPETDSSRSSENGNYRIKIQVQLFGQCHQFKCNILTLKRIQRFACLQMFASQFEKKFRHVLLI